MFLSVDSADQRKPTRLGRYVSTVSEIRSDPRTLVTMSRNWFVGLWQAKGGGFYGLGYVVTFLWLELTSLTGEISESASVGSFLAGQIFGYVIRFSVESFVNLATAFVWPAWLFQWLGVWTIPMLIVGFLGFALTVRPYVETWFPELREARLAKAAAKQARSRSGA